MTCRELGLVVVLVSVAGAALAQTLLGTAFTYQGRLDDNSQPANGPYDLQFALFDAVTGGNPVGAPMIQANVPDLWALRLEASLGKDDVRRINRHLAAILKVLRGARRDPAEGLMAVSWVLAPIPSGGRTKRRFRGFKGSAR